MPKNEVEISRDAERRNQFLEHLAISSHVAASATAANIPISTLYYWRENDADFYDAWMKALTTGYEMLEIELLQRARKGVEKKIFFAGNVIEVVRDYDNGMALRLLALHKDMVAKTRASRMDMQEDEETLRANLIKKIHDIRALTQQSVAIGGDNLKNPVTAPSSCGQ